MNNSTLCIHSRESIQQQQLIQQQIDAMRGHHDAGIIVAVQKSLVVKKQTNRHLFQCFHKQE